MIQGGNVIWDADVVFKRKDSVRVEIILRPTKPIPPKPRVFIAVEPEGSLYPNSLSPNLETAVRDRR